MEQRKSNPMNVYNLAVIGLMAAVEFISNFFSIPLGDVSRIHFGNIFCVLAGLMLGPVRGGLSAGIGAFFYDLTNPLFVSGAPFTFLFKFVIGYFSGLVAHGKGRGGAVMLYNAIGAILGSLSYVVLYLSKSFITEYFILRNPMGTVVTKMITKGAASLINAGLAVAIAVLIAPAFLRAMKRSGIYYKIFPDKARE